ncbi:MAG TPA: NTP transferase domain-containing protein [Gemmatimonadales bacterium]|nr:NTP transferase domain-containing protein [Gemmatimonadales bacterium]
MNTTPQPAQGPSLVILAAGMGSRFGGMKQLASVGPAGETLMDYSIHDALQAGFGSAVFIIRPEMEETFREFAGRRYGRRLAFRTVHQRLEDVPEGVTVPERPKPWGTGQAVLAAEPAVTGPFAVINADDYYGAEAYRAMADFLNAIDPKEQPPTFGLTGYRVVDTLSESGGVNRGVLSVSGDGMLASIEEVIDIRRSNGELEGHVSRSPRKVDEGALASMNMWGFTPAVFPILRDGFRSFLASPGAATAEYLLPTAIQDAIASGKARVKVLDPRSSWFGITYPTDAPAVSRALGRLVQDGRYPTPLFG